MKDIIIALLVAVLAGVIVAIIVGEGRFAPKASAPQTEAEREQLRREKVQAELKQEKLEIVKLAVQQAKREAKGKRSPSGPSIQMRWVINTVAVWAAVIVVPGIHPQGNWWLAIIGFALIFGLVNAVIRPIIEMLTCPFIILTLGLGTLLINTLLFWLTGLIGAEFGIGFTVDGFWPVFFGALIVTVASVALTLLIRDERRPRRAAK